METAWVRDGARCWASRVADDALQVDEGLPTVAPSLSQRGAPLADRAAREMTSDCAPAQRRLHGRPRFAPLAMLQAMPSGPVPTTGAP